MLYLSLNIDDSVFSDAVLFLKFSKTEFGNVKFSQAGIEKLYVLCRLNGTVQWIYLSRSFRGKINQGSCFAFYRKT